MRKFLVFLVTLLTLSASAEDAKGHKMVLCFKDGNKVAFVIKDKPQISFSGDKIVIESTNGSIDYLRSNVEDFHFDEIETSVESIEYNGEGNVYIFDLNGHLITMMKDDSLNSAKILLDSFKSGMYIIKIGNQSIKYLKK